MELTEDNFIIYAIKHYDNPGCKGMSEFYDDLKRFRYIKRLLKKYKPGKDQKERLIINHIVVLFNLFGIDVATRLLFFKIEQKHWSQLKSFLLFLNFMPVGPIIINDKLIQGFEIPFDEEVLLALGKM